MKLFEQNREVVFVFGAGTSYSCGIPMQSKLVELIILNDDKYLKESNAYKKVIPFIESVFNPDYEKNIFPTLETIYGYIEYHIKNKESMKGEYTINDLATIKEHLNHLLHYILNKYVKDATRYNPDAEKNTYSVFWDKICANNKNISIISLNYDTLLEESFDSHYLKDALIDYKIDFMNYDNEIGGWVGFHWWEDASKLKYTNITIGQKVYKPSQIRIIKPHGSFNWRYCDCCKRIFLTNWDTNVDLNNLGFKGEWARDDEWKYCPYDNTHLEQCIMPPTHFKDFSNNIISSLFTESVKELRKAKTICFVGYSFPEADIHVKAILDKIDLENKKIICVNPSCDDTLQYNYKTISDKVEFIETGFSEFLESECFAELIKKEDESNRNC